MRHIASEVAIRSLVAGLVLLFVLGVFAQSGNPFKNLSTHISQHDNPLSLTLTNGRISGKVLKSCGLLIGAGEDSSAFFINEANLDAWNATTAGLWLTGIGTAKEVNRGDIRSLNDTVLVEVVRDRAARRCATPLAYRKSIGRAQRHLNCSGFSRTRMG